MGDSGGGSRSSRHITTRSMFGLSMVGVLLMGAGATATWITVGIPNEPSHTAIRGTDLTDGVIVLACAILALIAAALGRAPVASWARLSNSFLIGAAVTSIVVTLVFVIDGRDRDAVIKALGVPQGIWSQVGAFRDLSAAPYVAGAGGLLCLFVGIRAFLRSPTPLADASAIEPPLSRDRQRRR